MLDRPAEYERMSQAEARHWWYRSLHRLTARALSAHPKRFDAAIVDAGCGTGGLLAFLRQRGYRNVSGFDVSPHAVALCRQRELPVSTGDLRDIHKNVSSGSADVIVSNDTLYFFTAGEQQRIIRDMAVALAPGGLLILNLPALKAFRGIHDLAVGIPKRYSPADVPSLFSLCQTECPLTVTRICFWPFVLAPAIYFHRLAQRRRLRDGKNIPIRSDLDVPPAAFNLLLEMTVRLENRVLPWKPFGSSMFVVAAKNG